MKATSRTTAALLIVFTILLTSGCAKSPSAVAEEAIRGDRFDFANASMAFEGDVSAQEEIDEDGTHATVTLLADDGSRRWVIDLEKQDGDWVVVDGNLELLEDVTITIP